ncbi:MAG: oligosaccharide flippase family protein [Acidimicrobiales bacterium]|nr:oligosaccharide flippase family protein [Acidimicrobiales bacterium]
MSVTTNADDASRLRSRRAAAGTTLGVVARVLSAAVGLLTVPIALDAVGEADYGIWMTVLSLTAFLTAADLGLNQAVVSRTAAALARGRRDEAARYVSTAFTATLAIAVGVAVVLAVAIPLVPWATLFGLDPSGASDAESLAAVLGLVFLVNLPLTTVAETRNALQEAWVHNLFLVVGTLVGVTGLLVAVWTDAGIAAMAGALAGGPVAVMVVNGALLLRRHPWLRPRPSQVRRRDVRELLGSGGALVVVRTSMLLLTTLDAVVIAAVLGTDEVTGYVVPARVVYLGTTVVGMALLPLWPAVADALARRDPAWARRTVERTLAAVIASTTLAGLLYVAFGQAAVRVWTGGAVEPPLSLLVALAVAFVVFSVANVLFVYLSGAQVLRPQAVAWAVMAALNVALSVILTRHLGILGPAVATTISLGVAVVVPSVALTRASLRREERSARGPSLPVA